MNMKRDIDNLENLRPAAWLDEALASAVEFDEFSRGAPEDASTAFRERCRAAALGPVVLRTLREERRRIGFLPLPLADYLQGIAQSAGLSLAPALAWLGISDLTQADEATTAALARLARDAGMSLREATAHLRLAFAAAHGAPLPAVLARRRSAVSSVLQEVEAQLDHVEASYEPPVTGELHRLEDTFRSAFGR